MSADPTTMLTLFQTCPPSSNDAIATIEGSATYLICIRIPSRLTASSRAWHQAMPASCRAWHQAMPVDASSPRGAVP